MSSLEIKVKTILDIKPHNNADRLELAIIDGWQTVIQKDVFKTGDKVIYLPIDCVLPDKMIDYFNLEFVRNTKNRVRAIKLRKEPSYGLILQLEQVEKYLNRKIKDNENLIQDLEITKYIEPEKQVIHKTKGKQYNTKWINFKKRVYNFFNKEKTDYGFNKYTEIENLRNNLDVFNENDDVVIHEKIHGMNARFGLIQCFNPEDSLFSIIKNGFLKKKTYSLFVGSHNMQRNKNDNSEWSKYLKEHPEIIHLLEYCNRNILSQTQNKQVVLYGEIYGKNIQDLEYSLNNSRFIAFDIMVNGVYLTKKQSEINCKLNNIQFVPTLYEGKFNLDIIKQLESVSSIDNKTIREGVIITSAREEICKVGRKTLKYVFDQYLTREKGTEYK